MARVLLRQSSSSSDKAWNYFFPDDILIEIFLRLPVQSLLLFRSLSKHWLGVIQSPSFIHLHNKSQNHINNPILLVHAHYKRYLPKIRNNSFAISALTMLSDDETTPYYQDQRSLKALAPSMYYNIMWLSHCRLLAPCNGLFCITDSLYVTIFNPATKKCREVPRSPFTFSFKRLDFDDSYYDRVSFGFDSASSDYKVVGFCNVDQQHHYKVQIFSLRTNSWTQVDRIAQVCDVRRLRKHDLFFNNAVHWFGCGFNDICSIVVFDLNKEVFNSFQLPDGNITKNDQVYLSVLDESFVVNLHRGLGKFQIWAMKEYGVCNSWKRLYNIDVGIEVTNPLSFDKDGEFLFEDSDRQLVAFNFKTSMMKIFGVYVIDCAFRYRERLVSLKRSKGEE